MCDWSMGCGCNTPSGVGGASIWARASTRKRRREQSDSRSARHRLTSRSARNQRSLPFRQAVGSNGASLRRDAMASGTSKLGRLGSRRTHQFAAERWEANGRSFSEASTRAGTGCQRSDGRSNAGNFGNAAKHAATRTRTGRLRGILFSARAIRAERADLAVVTSLRTAEDDLTLLLCMEMRANRSRCIV